MVRSNEYRIFGPPGTGKTTYLTRQIERAAEKYPVEQIMVASFTRTAANEIAGRHLKIPKSQVGTLHSFCFKLLGRPEIAETKKWIDIYNEGKIDKNQITCVGSLDDPYGLDMKSGKTDGDKALSVYNLYRTRLIPRDKWSFEVKTFEEKWEEFKKRNTILDFTDLILKCLFEVKEPPYGVRIGFFDECQDFSAAELALVRKWGETFDKFCVAGDDDQCIFSFRGATPDAFLNPPLPASNLIFLDKSYRLTKQVKNVSLEWINKVYRRQKKNFKPRDGNGQIIKLPNTSLSECDYLIKKTVEYASIGETSMILATCGYMLNPVIAKLRAQGIPFWNPYRPDAGRWNPWRGGIERMKAFLTDEVELWGDLTKPHTWSSSYKWIEILDSKKAKLVHGVKKICKENSKDRKLSSTELKKEDWEDLGIEEPRGNTEWFKSKILLRFESSMAYAFKVVENQPLNKLRDNPKIIIGTIHSVKGGQADNVFLFPDLPYLARYEIENGGVVELDNIRRVWYVGMTRAIRRLFICRHASSNASIFCYLADKFQETT